MEKRNFHRTIKVNVPAAEAMKKIGEVHSWWAKDFDGKAEMLNDKFSVHFGKTFVDFKISELLPDKKVVWQVMDCNLDWINNKKEWNGTEVVFELSGKNRSTQIDFTHVGLFPGVECYEDCEVGWDKHFTNSLEKFINEGKGMPQ